MPDAALTRLVALCPPPPRPQHARGDRGAARAANLWAIPDHVFEVVETYGAIKWMDWLHAPSLFSPSGIDALRSRSGKIQSLVAFSDPQGSKLFIGEDGLVSVSVAKVGVTATGKPLAEVLLGWLQGTEPYGLRPAKVKNAPELPPFAIPPFDDDRQSRVTWAFVRGGDPSRAVRWDALLAAFGPHVRVKVTVQGDKRQDKIHIPALEMNLIYDSINLHGGNEQLHLHHYVDRQPDVKAAVAAALAAAGMELVRVEGTKGASSW